MPEGYSGACKLHCFWLQLHYSPVNECTSQFIYSVPSHRVFYCLAKVYFCGGVRGGGGDGFKTEGISRSSIVIIIITPSKQSKPVRSEEEKRKMEIVCIARHAWIDESPSLPLPVDAQDEGCG